MTWTVTFTPHPTRRFVGDLTATYNAGLPDEFIRVIGFQDGLNIEEAVDAVIAEHAKWLARNAEKDALKAKIESAFQAAFDAAGGK